MSWGWVLPAAALAGVAAWGVLRPFGRSRGPATAGFIDPLDEERVGLLRSLRELHQDRVAGLIDEAEYRALKTDGERRVVAVLRALEARGGDGRSAAALRELRERAPGNGHPAPSTGTPRLLPALIVGVVVIASAVPLLVGAVRARSSGEPITGTAADTALSFFEQRVEDHPDDPAARLDLAQRYLESGDLPAAVRQYQEVLRLDPRNAEARARLGVILLRAGRPEAALRAVDEALRLAPAYAEALYFKGLILLQGLNRPADAAKAFSAYLEAAPFGGRRDDAERFLRQATGRADASG